MCDTLISAAQTMSITLTRIARQHTNPPACKRCCRGWIPSSQMYAMIYRACKQRLKAVPTLRVTAVHGQELEKGLHWTPHSPTKSCAPAPSSKTAPFIRAAFSSNDTRKQRPSDSRCLPLEYARVQTPYLPSFRSRPWCCPFPRLLPREQVA